MLSTVETLGIADNAVQFELNIPQARAITVMANESWIAAARGSGKTAGIIAPWILHKVHEMPGSNGGLIGQTFAQLDNRILQPLFLAFRKLGYIKHTPQRPGQYVYGKRPPEDWPEPLTPIEDYARVITFYNGTTVELISLQVEGSANGKSLQWIVGDEAKFFNEERLRGEIFPILRGHVETFGDSPWYGAKLFVTDKLHPNIGWFLKKKELCNVAEINAAIYYQTELNRLYLELDSLSQSEYYKRKRKIDEYEAILTVLRKNMVYYGEASALDNLKNLKDDYFKNMQRSLTPYEFKVSILNFDPKRSERNFYHGRSEKNLYYTPMDDDITEPIGITLDYQASISPLCSFQVNDLVNGRMQCNIVRSMHVKQPLGLKHVIEDFCAIHDSRVCKIVNYFYDHTATGERNMHKKYYEEVQDYFVAEGWEVVLINMGKAPGHGTKYNLINSWLQESTDSDINDYLPIGFNYENNVHLLLSMDLADTKETDKGTAKDKSKEKDKTFPQEEAPHHSDCFDQAVWAVNHQHLWPVRSTTSIAVNFR